MQYCIKRNSKVQQGDDPLIAYAQNKLGAVVSREVDLVTGEIVTRAPPGRAEDGGAPAMGLSNVHIRTRTCTLTYAKQGSFVKVSRPYTPDHEFHGGKRGIVQPFSRAARRRMIYTLARIDREHMPDFAHLTYPGRYEDDVKSIKQHLAALRMRLKRIGACAIWRLEFKRRKSGDSVGEIAPHYHFFVWWLNGWSMDERRQWLKRSWYEIVGSGQVNHFKSCEKVENIRTWNGVMYYAAKYIAKDVEGEVPAGCGRQWGWINYERIPWAEVTTEEITTEQCREAYKLFEMYVGAPIWRDECPSRTLLTGSPETMRVAIMRPLA